MTKIESLYVVSNMCWARISDPLIHIRYCATSIIQSRTRKPLLRIHTRSVIALIDVPIPKIFEIVREEDVISEPRKKWKGSSSFFPSSPVWLFFPIPFFRSVTAFAPPESDVDFFLSSLPRSEFLQLLATSPSLDLENKHSLTLVPR